MERSRFRILAPAPHPLPRAVLLDTDITYMEINPWIMKLSVAALNMTIQRYSFFYSEKTFDVDPKDSKHWWYAIIGYEYLLVYWSTHVYSKYIESSSIIRSKMFSTISFFNLHFLFINDLPFLISRMRNMLPCAEEFLVHAIDRCFFLIFKFKLVVYIGNGFNLFLYNAVYMNGINNTCTLMLTGWEALYSIKSLLMSWVDPSQLVSFCIWRHLWSYRNISVCFSVTASSPHLMSLCLSSS